VPSRSAATLLLYLAAWRTLETSRSYPALLSLVFSKRSTYHTESKLSNKPSPNDISYLLPAPIIPNSTSFVSSHTQLVCDQMQTDTVSTIETSTMTQKTYYRTTDTRVPRTRVDQASHIRLEVRCRKSMAWYQESLGKAVRKRSTAKQMPYCSRCREPVISFLLLVDA
jgi:hypothetical protein